MKKRCHHHCGYFIRSLKITILAVCVFLFSYQSFAGTKIIYIAPNGNDGNPGTRQKPLHSLTGARDLIRNWKKNSPVADTVIVRIADGTYFMNQPLVLEPMDSGTKTSPVIYKAAAGAHPVFNGGKEISGFKMTDQGLWKAFVP